MPAPHPKEFRDDVVAVARRGEAPIAQIAKDFGISESCLRNWLRQADVEDGSRGHGVAEVSVDGRPLELRPLENPYREAGVAVRVEELGVGSDPVRLRVMTR
jgi:transposase